MIKIKTIDKIKVAKIVKLSKKGDQNAFVELYDLSYRDIYQFIYSIVKDCDTADDILQETYITAFKMIGTLQDNSSFFSWLCSIAYHAGLKEYNRIKAKKDHEYGDYDILTIESSQDTPEEKAIKNEEIRLLRQAIDRLPEDQRACVTLYYYSDVPVKDIAQIIGCSDNTVKSRLRLARDKLKDVMEGG